MTDILLVPMNNNRCIFVSAVSKADVHLVCANETLRKEMRLILFQTCINEMYILLLRSPEELTGKRFDLQNISLLCHGNWHETLF